MNAPDRTPARALRQPAVSPRRISGTRRRWIGAVALWALVAGGMPPVAWAQAQTASQTTNVPGVTLPPELPASALPPTVTAPETWVSPAHHHCPPVPSALTT